MTIRLAQAIVRSCTLAACCAVLLSCTSRSDFDSYSQSISKFQSATATTSDAAAEYILSANDFVREIEFQRLEADPARVLNLPRLIDGLYDPAAIEARREAFRTLNAYTELLAALAESDAPTRWQAAAGRLGASAKGLAETLDEEAGTGLRGSPLVSILGEDGPLSTLVSFVGSEFINRTRAKALNAAITEAKPAIDQISDALRRDFRRAVELREIDARDRLLDVAIAYRTARETALGNPRSNAARLQALGEVRSAIETYEARMSELGRVVHALDAFDVAHDELVEYAQSDRSSKDLGRLSVVIDRYAAVAEALSQTLEARPASSGNP